MKLELNGKKKIENMKEAKKLIKRAIKLIEKQGPHNEILYGELFHAEGELNNQIKSLKEYL